MPTLIQIEIDNVKCDACGRSIHHALSAIDGVKAIIVDVTSSMVSVVVNDDLRARVVTTLGSIGYPERGTLNGLDAGIAAVRSYISCAIGYMM